MIRLTRQLGVSLIARLPAQADDRAPDELRNAVMEQLNADDELRAEEEVALIEKLAGALRGGFVANRLSADEVTRLRRVVLSPSELGCLNEFNSSARYCAHCAEKLISKQLCVMLDSGPRNPPDTVVVLYCVKCAIDHAGIRPIAESAGGAPTKMVKMEAFHAAMSRGEDVRRDPEMPFAEVRLGDNPLPRWRPLEEAANEGPRNENRRNAPAAPRRGAPAPAAGALNLEALRRFAGNPVPIYRGDDGPGIVEIDPE